MKNIHVLPTHKPSRLYKSIDNKLSFTDIEFEQTNNFNTNQHIYITSNSDLDINDWVTDGKDIWQVSYILADNIQQAKKIILTTDQDLIKDGVQKIDDEFLELFVKNPSCEVVEIKLVEQRSHLSLNDWVDADENGKFPISIAGAFCYRKTYKIIIPKEEPKREFVGNASKWNMEDFEEPKPFKDMLTMTEVNLAEFKKNPIPMKKETLEEAAERIVNSTRLKNPKSLFCEGSKWQQENSYSDMQEYAEFCIECDRKGMPLLLVQDWYEHYKK